MLNRAIKERIDEEHDLIQKLIADADARRRLMLACGMAIGPFTVWNDLDHLWTTTNYKPTDLKPWVDLGEFIKLHLLFQVVLDDGGYSFTARVRPDLEAKWIAHQRDPMDRIKRLTGKALAAQGLASLEYCYVVESRTKGGYRTGLHLHGFLLAQDPLISTRFKVAMEQAIGVHPKGRAAAGIKPKSGVEVDVEPAYDMIDQSKWGRGRWPGYFAKLATRWDSRFKRRVFISRTATQTARVFWGLLRDEPLD